MPSDLITAIKGHQSAFGLSLSDEALENLDLYHDLVKDHNPLLHLVAPCSAEEFAVRHILESLTLLEHLPEHAKFADVGTGAGLPSIPCLLAREDISAVLIETKEKKARFLEYAIEQLGLAGRAAVVNRQFEETDITECSFVTCRALDRFTERSRRLLRWAKNKTLVLFGGSGLEDVLDTQRHLQYAKQLIPLSERRYLYLVEPGKASL